MSHYYTYTSNGTYYVTYSSNTTGTWSTWSDNNGYYGGYRQQKPKKNAELVYLLKKYDRELRQINEMKQALGR